MVFSRLSCRKSQKFHQKGPFLEAFLYICWPELSPRTSASAPEISSSQRNPLITSDTYPLSTIHTLQSHSSIFQWLSTLFPFPSSTLRWLDSPKTVVVSPNKQTPTGFKRSLVSERSLTHRLTGASDLLRLSSNLTQL